MRLLSHVRRGYHKFGCTVLPHLLHRPDLASSEYRLPGHRHANNVPQNAVRQGRTATFTEYQYMLLFYDGRTLSTKTEITPKNNCAFISVKIA